MSSDLSRPGPQNRGRDYHYAVLGVPSSASPEELRERYRALSLIFHPDKQHHDISDETRATAEKRHLEVQKAYEVLSDPFLRVVYDTLGDTGTAIPWPEHIRHIDPKDLRKTLRSFQRESVHLQYEGLVRPQGQVTLGYDFSPFFDDERGGEDPVLEWVKTLQRMGQSHFGVQYSVQKQMTPKTSLTLGMNMNRYMDQHGRANVGAGLVGTVRHQFSPRLHATLAVPLLEPNPFAAMAPLKMRYLTAAGMWHLETFLSPLFLIQRRLPPATLQYNRQLYPNSGLQGYIAASSGPSPSLVLGVTNPVGFDFYKSSQIPRSEDEEGLADVPSVPRAGLAVFTRGALFSDYGVTLAGMGSNVKAEWGVDFEEAAIELRAGGYLRLTGDIEWNVTVIWKWRPQDSLGATGIVLHGQQDTSLLATVALTLEGVLLRFEAQYLGQKFTLPIVLSNFSDDRLALWFTLVPATATALYYSFFTRPRSRTRRARVLNEARAKLNSLAYEPRREASETSAILADTASRHMRAEKACDGLVIEQAVYTARENGKEIEGLAFDVTVPLQALVHRSQLHVPSTRSKAQVPGFYDPLPGGEKTLNIRYTFGGRPHFVEVVDGAPVTLPQSDHLMEL